MALSARARHPLDVRGIRRQLHVRQPDVRAVHVHESDDRLARDPGFHRRRHIPTVFASAYTVFPRWRMPIIVPTDRVDCDPGADHRPDRRRLSHRCAVLALAVFYHTSCPASAWSGRDRRADRFDKPEPEAVRTFDWWGLIFMAAFLGSLEYVLEEGQRYNWFDDETITLFAVLSAVSAVAFFVRVFAASRSRSSISRRFTNRNFALGSMFSFVLGIGLYGLTYLYPLYLGARGRATMTR